MQLKMRECQHCAGTGRVPDAGVGETLRTKRERAGVSIRKLAAALDISFGYLSDLERGNRNFSTQLAVDYVEKLEELRNGD